jgi:hypothetical protein
MEDIIQNTEASNQASTIQQSFEQEADVMKVFEQPEMVEPEVENSVQTQQKESEVEIDEKFKDLDPYEARIRTLQSRHDKIYNEYQNLVKQRQEDEKYLQILNDILEDDIVFEAFVNERKPGLIKETDVTDVIQKKLREEFGDVRYTRAEADENPGGKAWLYFKRLDELYNELKGNNPKITTLKEAIAYKRAMKEKQEKEQQALLLKEIEAVKKKFNWDDNKIREFQQWAQKLTVVNLASIYNYAVKALKVPSATSIQGTPNVNQSLRSKFLNNL